MVHRWKEWAKICVKANSVPGFITCISRNAIWTLYISLVWSNLEYCLRSGHLINLFYILFFTANMRSGKRHVSSLLGLFLWWPKSRPVSCVSQSICLNYVMCMFLSVVSLIWRRVLSHCHSFDFLPGAVDTYRRFNFCQILFC